VKLGADTIFLAIIDCHYMTLSAMSDSTLI
jgi:hypothetical protein